MTGQRSGLEATRGLFIVLGVSGSIAAYKVVELARHLTQAGAVVQVVMTRSAAEFVRPLTFQALTYRPVELEMFGPLDDRAAGHVAMGQQADLIVIAPATAHVIARLAHGFADDLLATTVLAAHAPVIVCPAMETHMWANPATRANIATLRGRGMRIVQPEAGELASGQLGQGRLAAIERIEDAISQAVGATRSLAGRRVIVTAGPTIEPIDPVRVISNRSSGKMGYAIAAAAHAAGADVTLISGPTALAAPAGVRFVPIETAAELRDAVFAVLPDAEAVVMAAAVADYRVADPSGAKVKKRDAAGEVTLRLVENADVLKAVIAKRRPGTFVVGFKAETGDPVPEAARLLSEKGPDLVVANDVSSGVFGADTDTVTLVSADGTEPLPLLPKAEVARRLVERIAQALARG